MTSRNLVADRQRRRPADLRGTRYRSGSLQPAGPRVADRFDRRARGVRQLRHPQPQPRDSHPTRPRPTGSWSICWLATGV